MHCIWWCLCLWLKMWKWCAAVICEEKKLYLITVEIDEIVEIVFLRYLINVCVVPYYYVIIFPTPYFCCVCSFYGVPMSIFGTYWESTVSGSSTQVHMHWNTRIKTSKKIFESNLAHQSWWLLVTLTSHPIMEHRNLLNYWLNFSKSIKIGCVHIPMNDTLGLYFFFL